MSIFGDYVDTSGKVAFNKRYLAFDFSEGLAVVRDEGSDEWGYINTAGDFGITPRFDTASSFSEGLARISLDSRFGYIDRTGRIVIPAKFAFGDDFHDGLARVVIEGPCTHIDEGPCALDRVVPNSDLDSDQVPRCKYDFIDRSGNLITSKSYDAAGDFSEGLAPVRVGTKWGYIDKSGQIVIEPKFDAAAQFAEGLAVVQQGKWCGYVDRTGEFAIPPNFPYAEDFSEGLAVVGFSNIYWDDGKGHIDRAFWYINKQGKQAIPERFDLAGSFFKGVAHVRLKPSKTDDNGESNEQGPFAYINATGNKVFTY